MKIEFGMRAGYRLENGRGELSGDGEVRGCLDDWMKTFKLTKSRA